jgi:hypothetical protein
MPLLLRAIRCCGKNDAAVTYYTSRRRDLLQDSTKRDDSHSIEFIYIRNKIRPEKEEDDDMDATKHIAQDPTARNHHVCKDMDKNDVIDFDDMSDLTIGSLRDLDSAPGCCAGNEKTSVASSSNGVSTSKPTFSWNSSMTCKDDEYSA